MKRVEGHCTFQTITADELLAAAKMVTATETLGIAREPRFFGTLPFRDFFAPEVGVMIHFQGWPDTTPRFLLATFLDPPWLGIIQPLAKDQALVRRIFLADAPPTLTDQILQMLTSNCPAATDFHDVPFWKALAQQVGLTAA